MNLLWFEKKEYESIIVDNVFHDLGIISLFEKFRRNVYDILETIKYIPKESTVRYRSDIFKDFLCDDNNTFYDIKKLADDVVHYYKAYTLTKQTLKRHIIFLLYINNYITFFDKTLILLREMKIGSKGIMGLKEYVEGIVGSNEFISLKNDIDNISYERIKEYAINNKGKYIVMEESENSFTINSTLRDLAEDISSDIHIRKYLHTKEIDSLYLIALEKLYNKETETLHQLHMKYAQLEFSLSQLGDQIDYYLFFKSIFKECKVPYSIPTISNDFIRFKNVYNISLYGIKDDIVPNDCLLDRVTVVTGVNGGGKTSFLQSIGANYIFFFAVGHIFADGAELLMVKHLYTHFPNNEEFKLGYGRLKNELYRLNKMTPNFSKDCLLLLNETFSSTDDETAYGHAKKLIKDLQSTSTNTLYVTHHHKIIDIPDINILVPLIDKSNKRLFKIVRKTDDINMYTFDILYRYGLTKVQLEARVVNEKL